MTLSNVKHTTGGCAGQFMEKMQSWVQGSFLSVHSGLLLTSARGQSCLGALDPLGMLKIDLLGGCGEGREEGQETPPAVPLSKLP